MESDVAIEPADLDLGTHPWGEEIPLEVRLRNDRSAPVRVKHVRTNCGCVLVAATCEGAIVQPGATLPIGLTLETQAKPGKAQRTVTIELDSGDILTSAIRLRVEPRFVITPEDVDFGNVRITDTERIARILQFTSTYGEEIRGAPEANCKWLTCSMAARAGATDIALLLDTEHVPPGVSVGTVIIPTTDSTHPEYAIYVKVRGVQDLYPRPAYVALIGQNPQLVKIQDDSGSEVDLVSATPNDPSIETEILNPGTVRIRSKAKGPLPRDVCLDVIDDRQRKGRLIVSTF